MYESQQVDMDREMKMVCITRAQVNKRKKLRHIVTGTSYHYDIHHIRHVTIMVTGCDDVTFFPNKRHTALKKKRFFGEKETYSKFFS